MKKGLHCTDFHKTHFCCWYCVGVFCTKFHPYVSQNMENLGRISYMPFGKVWVSLTEVYMSFNIDWQGSCYRGIRKVQNWLWPTVVKLFTQYCHRNGEKVIKMFRCSSFCGVRFKLWISQTWNITTAAW